MWESLARVNAVVGGVVWGPVGLALLFGTGCLLTVRTGFFQLRYFGYWMRHTIGAIFLDRNVTAHTDDEAISQFQSLCTALAATIGTGNIVGVAAAILAGGPGAVFWMWVMALLGMMTSYAENVLGICYRRRDAAGRWCGGPMYYLAEGLGGGFGRALAVLFACFCVLASFGMGNMSQINSIAGNLQAVFRVPPVATGIVLALLTGRVILGGLKRVAAVTEAIVPLMALFYLFGALTVVCVHWAAVPAAFAAIFRGAFGLQAAGGGVLGYGMARAISWGFKRGAFSNEAGLGASVLVHCAANVEEPVQQGMWGRYHGGLHPHGPCGTHQRPCGSGHRCGPDRRGRLRTGGAGLFHSVRGVRAAVHRGVGPAVCLFHYAGVEPLRHPGSGVSAGGACRRRI